MAITPYDQAITPYDPYEIHWSEKNLLHQTFFPPGVGGQTQGLEHAREMLYH
jgi:hypothetical protein